MGREAEGAGVMGWKVADMSCLGLGVCELKGVYWML